MYVIEEVIAESFVQLVQVGDGCAPLLIVGNQLFDLRFVADVCLFSENPIGVHLLVILHISFDGIIKQNRNLEFLLDPGIPPPD